MRTILFLLCFLSTGIGYGQMKTHLDQIKKADQAYHLKDIKPLRAWKAAVPSATNFNGIFSTHLASPKVLQRPVSKGSLQVTYDEKSGLPIFVSGTIPLAATAKNDWQGQAIAYLEVLQNVMQIEQATTEFQLAAPETDELGQTHLRGQQMYKGIKVYGAEILLHGWDDRIQLLNGRTYPTPTLASVTPAIAEQTAARTALTHVSKHTRVINFSEEELQLIPGKPVETELVIYHKNQDLQAERLAWYITLYPNVLHRWIYVIDALNGNVIDTWKDGCNLHHENSHITSYHNSELPPGTASAKDLLGTNRTINIWQDGSNYYLLDASRAMFNATQSDMPGSPVGAIVTLDFQNSAYDDDQAEAYFITGTNNVWNNPTAVSAHYNANRAYEYFRQTFNRNSINGQGGNILSIINVANSDGGGYDNASWNGKAMFYGNGKNAFRPLARSLDVAGHEMTHGVIGSSAGLEYRNEAGAINESFADVFAVMIDRDDWLLGEDVVNSQYFPTGALRNMQNPSNGGTQRSDNGWQPDHVNKQYRGTDDNGGVHINSGITNRAFYLFATAIGKDKAEQVYYRALTRYLTRTSQFIDLRLAVIQAATDLHGASSTEVQAAATAFTTVGILGSSGGGTTPPADVIVNPGQQLILYTDRNKATLHLVTPQGTVLASPLSRVAPLSKPSITDDGTLVLYIAQDKTMRGIEFNWNQSTYEEFIVSDQPIWRNVAISRDGARLAALTDDFDNKIYVSNVSTGDAFEYELYNPTYTQNVSTEDVQYADVLEWDFAGEYVMYDAFNKIASPFGDIEYWDIGFIEVWNNAANDYADGFIGKLYAALPENVSIGNPTFTKNSPYIIAFDYLDEANEEYYILGANIETGDLGTIYQNSDVSFPNYAVNDNQLLLDGVTTSGNQVLGVVNLATDKINAQTDPPTATILISGGNSGARWGVWFANGTRDLTDNEAVKLFDQSLKIFPNPFEEILYLRGAATPEGAVTIEVFDQLGKRVNHLIVNAVSEKWEENLDLRNLPMGSYVIRVKTGAASVSRTIVKFK